MPQERPIRAPVRAPVHAPVYAPAREPVQVPEQEPVYAQAGVTKKELQNWEVDSIVMPYTYTPAQPSRKIEAKVGHVTDDVIAVHEEPDVRSMSTQTEAADQPSMSYKNLWLEERRVRQRDVNILFQFHQGNRENEWPFHIKFMTRAFGEFHKLHIK